MGLMLAGILLPSLLSWQKSALPLQTEWVRALPLSLTSFAALVTLDLAVFVAHFAFHRIPFLWSLHEIHHSSQQLDSFSTFRSHPLGQIALKLGCPIGLVLLGFGESEILFAGCIYNIFAVFNHVNILSAGTYLDYLFCTPRFHRNHHSSVNPDCNYGTVFSWWDLLIGAAVFTDIPHDPKHPVLGFKNYPKSWWAQTKRPFRRRFPSKVREEILA